MEDSGFNIKYAKLFIKRAEEDLEVAKVLLKQITIQIQSITPNNVLKKL